MKRVAKPAAASDSGNGVPSVSEQLESPSRPSVPRLSVARLNLPKIGLPKLAIPSLGLRTPPAVEAETETTAEAEAEAAAEVVAEAETELAAEEVPEAETEHQSEAETPAEVSEPDATVADASASAASIVLSVRGLTKSFDNKVAVDGIDLDVHVGAFYGIVGPNGAGKTTTLSMITGLLRPTAGSIVVNGADVWSDPVVAKRTMGVLPDRLRLFDRLTGSQVLYYAGVLRGLDAETVRKRTADLAQAFGLEEALGRLVSDYSAGMTKKIALAAAMIHTPRLLVLDEPFESVDPVSAATVTEILKNYVAFGGTVVLSSHSMDLVQRICDHVAVIVNGVILADGTMAHVRNGLTLEDRFVELAGGRKTVEGLEWLHTFSD
jgi:ABC-2 type transport system ATP-binding protein